MARASWILGLVSFVIMVIVIVSVRGALRSVMASGAFPFSRVDVLGAILAWLLLLSVLGAVLAIFLGVLGLPAAGTHQPEKRRAARVGMLLGTGVLAGLAVLFLITS